jgi:Skp family chaperone for outer membrane proteins
MATAQDFLNQIQGIEGSLGQYEQMLPNAASQIKQEIGKLVDYGKPALQDVASMQERAFGMLPGMGEQYAAAAPTDRTSALSALGRGIGQFGSALGQRDVFQDVANRQGLRIEDIARTATEAYKMPYELALERMGRITPLYQTQVGIEEAQKGRDFTAEQNELQRQYEALEAAKQRAYQTGEREAGQQFQAEQDRLGREWSALENEKNRENQLRAAAASKPESIDINALMKNMQQYIKDYFGDWNTTSKTTTPQAITLAEAQSRQPYMEQLNQLYGGTSSTTQPKTTQTYTPSTFQQTAPWNK